MTHLEEWKLQYGGYNCIHLVGVVSEHPRYPNGTIVTTSRVIDVNMAERKAETLSRTYHLGAVDIVWAKEPGSERMIDAFKKIRKELQ